MDLRPISDDELIEWACDELEGDALAGMETRLAASPALKSRALAYRQVLDELRESADTQLSESFNALLLVRARELLKSGTLATEQDDALLLACDELSPRERAEAAERVLTDREKSSDATSLSRTVRQLAASIQDGPSEQFNVNLRLRLESEQAATARNARAAPATHQRWWLNKVLAGTPARAAAAIAIVVLLVLMFKSETPTMAYDIREAPQRIRRLSSIHVKGKLYNRVFRNEGQAISAEPYEIYYARPGMYWHTHAGGGGQSGYYAGDGQRYVNVRHDLRQVTEGSELQAAAMLTLESGIDSLTRQLLGGDNEPFEKIREEFLDGIPTTVYQKIAQRKNSIRRNVVWIDAKTGLPVRSEAYDQYLPDPEWLRAEFTLIVPNAAPPEDLFPLRTPSDYTVIEQPIKSADIRLTRNDHLGHQFTLRTAINIDDKALLVCWRLELPDGSFAPAESTGSSELPVRVYPGESQVPWDDQHFLVRTDWEDDRPWYWTLFMGAQTDSKLKLNGGYVRVQISGRKLGNKTAWVNPGLPGPDSLLEQLQKLTLSDTSQPKMPITLPMLRQIIRHANTRISAAGKLEMASAEVLN